MARKNQITKNSRSLLVDSAASHHPDYPTDVFISYSWKNKSFVDHLVADLTDHHISSWLDRLELEVGDKPRQEIEKAIESCRYFCLVISEASLRSYYVRQLEIEAAFQKMLQSGRTSFILPIVRQRPKEPLPLMLANIQHLDCTTPMKYAGSIKKLAKKIKLDSEAFTGARLYKNIDTSLKGEMVGVGEILQVPRRGSCVRVFFQDGQIRTVELITDGNEDGVKSVLYDNAGRVYEIILFRNNRVIDTWRYIYDEKTGKRRKKLTYRPGEKPHTESVYNEDGRRIADNALQ